jgi:excisionase family DNA binding protein
MVQDSKLLRIKEVADLLGVNVRTVYRRIWDGKLPASKIGGLYYIRESDLQALLQPSIEHTETPGTIKCESCLRLFRSASDISAECLSEACKSTICKSCYASGVRYCNEHALTQNADEPARKKAARKGEISGNEARVREMAFIERVVARISQVDSFIDPETGDVISVTDWSKYLIDGDSRAEVLQITGKAFLEAWEVARLPLNAWAKYRLSDFHRSDKRPVFIEIRVLSRLARMIKEGKDTAALEKQNLNDAIYHIQQDAKADPGFRFIVLAATTGWSKDVWESVIKGDQRVLNLPPSSLLYLYDIEDDELIYAKNDTLARQYAGLFIPISVQEEAQNAIDALERLMASRAHTSVTLNDAIVSTGYAKPVIEEAFRLMTRSGFYRQLEMDDLGKVLQKTNY